MSAHLDLVFILRNGSQALKTGVHVYVSAPRQLSSLSYTVVSPLVCLCEWL